MIDFNTKDQHGLTLFHYPCKKGSIFIFHFETPCFLATDLVIIRSSENISQSRILHPKKEINEVLSYCFIAMHIFPTKYMHHYANLQNG